MTERGGYGIGCGFEHPGTSGPEEVLGGGLK